MSPRPIVPQVGITSHLEGEEMPVNQPGFLGGDRTSLDMPQPEEDLVQAVAATGKPLVVVLMNGSALGVNWEKAHANAILEGWYSGEEGGAAIAETLSGKNNPAGQSPSHLLQGRATVAPFRGLLDEGAHLPLLRRRAALGVWIWAELHDIQLQQS
jgi:hypothetical protein